MRRDILFRQVDDSYATIGRQAFFAMFERKAHEMVLKNASVDDISAMYFENLKEQFGDSLELSEEFKWEWVAIPHFYHTPFYVYAYAFGKLLVLSLYKQFKAEGEILQAEVSQDPLRRRIGSPGEDPGRGRHRHPLGGILAGRLRCDQGTGGGVGKVVGVRKYKTASHE